MSHGPLWLACYHDGLHRPGGRGRRQRVGLPVPPWLTGKVQNEFGEEGLHMMHGLRHSLKPPRVPITGQTKCFIVALISITNERCCHDSLQLDWHQESLVQLEYYKDPTDAYEVEIVDCAQAMQPLRHHFRRSDDHSSKSHEWRLAKLTSQRPLYRGYWEGDVEVSTTQLPLRSTDFEEFCEGRHDAS